MGRTWGHGGEATTSAAAQQAQDQRLGLIVGGVAGQRVGRECLLARCPRPRFEVGAGLDQQLVQNELDTELGCERTRSPGIFS